MAVPGLVAAAALLSFGVALFVRAPEEADLALLLAVNGPRTLLAAAVGIAFGVAGAILGTGAASRKRETTTFGASAGALVGGMQGVELGFLGPALADFVLGGVIGALVFAALLLFLSRAGRVANLAVGLAMFVMLGFAVVAAVAAKGDPGTLRDLAWWTMGDFTRAGFGSAAAVFGLVAVAAAWALRRPSSGVAVLLWGLAIGAGGIIAWVSLLVPLAASPLDRERSHWLPLCAALGALTMIWADALPRLLLGGYAAPVGISVALVAIPWYLVSLGLEGKAAGKRGWLRVADYSVGGLVALTFVGVTGILTLIIYIAG